MNANDVADPFQDKRARGLGISGLNSKTPSVVVRRRPSSFAASSLFVPLPFLIGGGGRPSAPLGRRLLSSACISWLDSETAYMAVQRRSFFSGGGLLAASG